MSRRGNLLFGWSLALAAIALFANLGLWQARRAVEKQAMLDAAAQVLSERVPQPLSRAADPQRAHAYDWAAGQGRFDPRGALLLDNQQRGGRAGVRAYRLFLPDGGEPLLVDLGWLPLGGERKFPAVPKPEGELALRGLLSAPPSVGIPLGPGIGREGQGWLLTRVDTRAIAAALGLPAPLAPRVLRLDPALPLGYDRDLELLSNTLPPDKHRGYSLQWFALAAAVLATALILTFRRPRRGADR
ncbi:SURF1 family protein [Lysobacter enzymogenes]|uniref:SURF1 family protein n=1 Tax=Lysobacter enzymogenes TaxID=69 RepID=UPI001A97A598|nr:SURF1 family protein [Lysobacter enzymogenes]QQP94542.1 SURF1 family protein [Lysobacter enzymogenes]